MSKPAPPQPAKLVIGFFLKDKPILSQLLNDLTQLFGPVDTVSAWLPFNYTQYYATEMGGPLFRRLASFKKLIQQDELAAIKLKTNMLESDRTQAGRRQVNIDPGYMLGERFVLATGKNFTHRIYVGQGIYADLTLIFQKGGFKSLPWTYPDYAAQDMQAYLTLVRKKYLSEIKRLNGPSNP